MEHEFNELLNQIWKAIEQNKNQEKARNLSILKTEFEKLYAYYRIFVKE